MDEQVLDFFNRPIKIDDYVVGTGRTNYSGLSVGRVTGFTPTGMISIVSVHAWSLERPRRERIRRAKDCIVISKDLIPRKILYEINTFSEGKNDENRTVSR